MCCATCEILLLLSACCEDELDPEINAPWNATSAGSTASIACDYTPFFSSEAHSTSFFFFFFFVSSSRLRLLTHTHNSSFRWSFFVRKFCEKIAAICCLDFLAHKAAASPANSVPLSAKANYLPSDFHEREIQQEKKTTPKSKLRIIGLQRVFGY